MPDVHATRPCPACGVPNRQDRELCVTCGADLDSGDLPPRPTGRWSPTPSAGDDRDHRAGSNWWWVLLAVVLGVVIVVTGLTVAGLGPLAGGGPDVPDATFDEASYGGERGPLVLTDIGTRTSRDEVDGRRSDAAMMVDDSPQTAWRSEGSAVPDGDRPGEEIDLVLEQPAWVSRLVLRNGDHLDAEDYADASRLREARLTFDGGVSVIVDLQDAGLQEQEIELPEPVLTTVVRIEVLDVFAGTDDDLAISDLRVEGWRAVGEDLELATRRADARPATGTPSPLGFRLG